MERDNEPAQPFSERQLSFLGQIWRSVMRVLSCGLIGFFAMLYFSIFYSFIFDNVFFYYIKSGGSFLLAFVLLIIGLWLGFNLLFNFVLTCMVSPGLTKEYFRSVVNERMQSPFVYDPSKSQFNKSMLYRKIDASKLAYCNKCKLPKPQRAHHCSICNQCVLKMDHHCPWINQCVGFYNHRYFLLFLIYTALSTGYVTLLNIPILLFWWQGEISYLRSEFYFILWPLNAVMAVMIAAFAGWHLYLVFKAETTLEFWISKNQKWDLGNPGRNFALVFGNYTHFWQIFLPSLRELPSNGIIWDLHEISFVGENRDFNQENKPLKDIEMQQQDDGEEEEL